MPNTEKNWSGTLCPHDPDNCWIDDKTGEHVNAVTGERTASHFNAPALLAQNKRLREVVETALREEDSGEGISDATIKAFRAALRQ